MAERTTIERGTFEVRITPSGVTFSESNYFGWVKPHEGIFPALDYDNQGDDALNPFGIEIWKRKGKMTRIVDIDDGFTSSTAPTVTSVVPQVTGSTGTPEAIVAGTGIEILDAIYEIQFVEGSGGAVTITANPRIEAGTEGYSITLIGTSDTNTVTFTENAALDLQGQTVTLYDGTTATFVFADSKWTLRALTE